MRVLRLHLVHLTGTRKKKPSSRLGFFVLAQHEHLSFTLCAVTPAPGLRIHNLLRKRAGIIKDRFLFRIETLTYVN